MTSTVSQTTTTDEDLIVETGLVAGPGSGAGGVWLNHAEDTVDEF